GSLTEGAASGLFRPAPGGRVLSVLTLRVLI
ncbi:MAG: hypothetical protein JWR49_3904, partial [Tardiphaga sp.]|nr:hypothetical protein [Tardiphaga sp.]